MTVPYPTPAEPTDGSGTLGDLLYADKTKARVSEQEWTALVQAIGHGDQRALHALYERAHRLVFTLAMRIVNDRATAEELTVDVFHDVWRRASNYDPADGTVLGWIMNQARSRAIDRVRFEQRKKRVNPHAHAATDDAVEVPDVGDGHQLREALTALTPNERLAIETAFFGELSYKEAAARLDEPLGTIKTRIRTGLGKLRQALQRGAQE